MPTTPVLLVDNVFDRINQYRAATITTLTEAPGREGWRVATYRRERQWWQATSDGNPPSGAWNQVKVDLGVGITAGADYFFVDRGHNLWGKTVYLVSASVDSLSTFDEERHFTVPALGAGGAIPVGGNPTTGICVTEEGALYVLFSAPMAARRYWRFEIVNVAGFIPAVMGVMAGTRTQLLGYSAIFDEDAGGRKLAGGSAESDAGYLATGRAYSWRTLELDLKYIGATEYDATMRRLRKLLFERNTPFVACMDYTTAPERAWMYQYDGNQWGFPKSRVYRSGRLRCRELAPKLDG